MIFIHFLLLFFIIMSSYSSASLPRGAKPLAIYHAHNLSFKEIEKKLPTIAQLGFSHIQISPPQKSRDTLPDHKKMVHHDPLQRKKIWWLHYQPESYDIDDTFGNEDELRDLVTTAQKFNIKIIADVILTHIRAPDHIESHNWKSAYLACQLCTYVKGKEQDGHVQCTDVRDDPFCTKNILSDVTVLKNQTILADINACRAFSSDAADHLENLYLTLRPIVAHFLGITAEKVTLNTISEIIYPWRLGYQPGSWTSGFGAPALRTDSFLVADLQRQYISHLIDIGIQGFRYDAASNLPFATIKIFRHLSKVIPSFFQYGEIVDTLENSTNWRNTMKISITNYPFLISLKNALSFHGSLQSIWEFYTNHVHDEDVIFTATHDTFGEDASLAYYIMSDAQDSQSITNDNLLALSIILALPKGIPLILHDYVDNNMSFYAPHPDDPKRNNNSLKIVESGLKFREIMFLKQQDQDYFSYHGDDPNVLIIERHKISDKKSRGFAIINKGLRTYSYPDLLLNTKFVEGCYQSLGVEPVIINVSKDHQAIVDSGNPNFPKREAKFFVEISCD